MTMTKGFIACLPVIVLIVLVMLSHRMTESMFIASLLASLLAYKQDFLCGYVEMIYNALSNPSYQLLLIVSCSFGGMIMLLEKSGSLFGFQRFMVRFCTTPHRTMILTWILGGIIFIDDYLNALAVSVSMKGEDGKNKRKIKSYIAEKTPFNQFNPITIEEIKKEDFSSLYR